PVSRLVNGVVQLTTQTVTTFPNGRVSESIYDLTGRLLSQTEKSGGTVLSQLLYAYDADGHLTMTQDADGNRNFMLYDYAGRKSMTVDGKGRVVEYKYNAQGQLSEEIQHAVALDVSAYGMSLATSKPESIMVTPDANDIHVWRFYDVAGRLSET